MTEKLYQSDSYLQEMTAAVVKREERFGGPALLLDRTVFYPTSGGQQHDTGTIAGVSVIDVQADAEGIWHVTGSPLLDEQVTGRIDWPRRFDFMQQHTGFHLLAGAFYQGLGIKTLAAHLGEEESTIEVAAGEISAAEIEQVEALANRTIWENRAVTARLVTAEEAAALKLRKAPQVEGVIRLIEIDGFDLDPCGGTHVRATGEVGLVKIIGRERIRQGQRFTFLAGGRAWGRVQQHHQVLAGLAQLLTTDYASLAPVIARLMEENKGMRKELQQRQQQLAEEALAALLAAAGEAEVISHLFAGAELELVRLLAASAVRQRPGIYLFGGSGGRAAVIFAASREEPRLRDAFTAAMEYIDGRGGGSATFLQGSGSRSDRLAEALERAGDFLRSGVKNC